MRILGTFAVTSIFVGLVACGTADPSGSNYRDPQSGGIGGKDGNAGGDNGLGGNKGGGKPAGDFSACATATAGADAKPVYLVIAFDKSGSMNDNGKWDAAKSAMKGFFGSPDAKGISASITFFPQGNRNTFCNTGLYATPQVPMTALPNDAFGAALDANSPNGPTPTLSVLTASINYAKSIQGTTAKDGTVAVVMVTDGLPEGCSDNLDVGPASNEAASVASTIKTYVVGVGDLLSNLNQIASSGGTKSAFVVSVGNPTQTQSDLTTAINQIRASALSCDYGIPAPPQGQSFDREKVNVQFTPSGGAPSALQHNQSCSGGAGWRYDDVNNPKRILACDGTCNEIKAKSGKVDVVFGCATVNANVQ